MTSQINKSFFICLIGVGFEKGLRELKDFDTSLNDLSSEVGYLNWHSNLLKEMNRFAFGTSNIEFASESELSSNGVN